VLPQQREPIVQINCGGVLQHNRQKVGQLGPVRLDAGGAEAPF
jgi:hypothetical protein